MSCELTESFPWLASPYIKTLLEKYEGHDNLELIDFNVSSGSAQGDNFAGVILRVTVNYFISESKKKVNFILKASPVAGAVAELLDNLGVYEGETFIYHKVQNECKALLPGFRMAPRYFSHFYQSTTIKQIDNLSLECI